MNYFHFRFSVRFADFHFKKHPILETRTPSIAEKVHLQTDVLANSVHLINLIIFILAGGWQWGGKGGR